ncbi:MAG: glycosyltransferase family 9 protein [Veillonella sp.]|nr:glycosyltransferase family 9 protein [Veillonella sp.]
MKDYKNILIIKMSSLGDVIHALPTLYAVRKNWPNAHITWAIHEQFESLLPGKPWVDDVIIIDKKVSLLSGAPEKYGYWELREGSNLVNKALVGEHKYDHVIERYLDTVRALGGDVEGVEFPMPAYVEAEKSVKHKLQSHGVEDEYVVVVPGARWIVKEWPLLNFGELCIRLCESGKKVVIAGAPDDAEKGAFIENYVKNKNLINLVGSTSMPELIELIRHCEIFISADTGPLHIANALKRPLIALFGTTSPKRTGPYGGSHVHLIISPTSKATPEQPLVDDPDCMAQIPVDAVWSVYEQVIGKEL